MFTYKYDIPPGDRVFIIAEQMNLLPHEVLERNGNITNSDDLSWIQAISLQVTISFSKSHPIPVTPSPLNAQSRAEEITERMINADLH